MIPLMVQNDYSPKGWLGLILGTRVWYAMWEAEKDDDAGFERRLESVVREIGDRGKVMIPEAVTPFREPTPAPAPAPTPSPVPAPALAPAPATAAALASALAPALAPAPVRAPAAVATPSMVQPTTPSADTRNFAAAVQQPALPGDAYPLATQLSIASTGAASATGSFETMAAFFNGQQDKLVELLREERDEANKQRHALELKLEEQRRESEAKAEQQRQQFDVKVEQLQRESETKAEQQQQELNRQRQHFDVKAEQLQRESEAKAEQLRHEIEQLQAEVATRPPLALDAIDEDQLAALQSRLQSMHGAKLLTDDELFSLEDAIVDCIEVMPTAGALASEVERVSRMLVVASKVPSDGTLARQLRRKLL